MPCLKNAKKTITIQRLDCATILPTWWCGVVYLTDYRTTPVNIVQLCTGLGCGNTFQNSLLFHFLQHFTMKKMVGMIKATSTIPPKL